MIMKYPYIRPELRSFRVLTDRVLLDSGGKYSDESGIEIFDFTDWEIL